MRSADCGFAPGSILLDKRYTGAALEFFRVARERIGLRSSSALSARGRRRNHARPSAAAVLRYIIEGAKSGIGVMSCAATSGVVAVASGTPSAESLCCGAGPIRTRSDSFSISEVTMCSTSSRFSRLRAAQPDPEMVLGAIHNWWIAEGAGRRDAYAGRIYPTFFSPSQLREASDRAAWFTMFALGLLSVIRPRARRTAPELHRGRMARGLVARTRRVATT